MLWLAHGNPYHGRAIAILSVAKVSDSLYEDSLRFQAACVPPAPRPRLFPFVVIEDISQEI